MNTQNTRQRQSRKIVVFISAISLITVVISISLTLGYTVRAPQTSIAQSAVASPAFPDIDASQFSEKQTKLLILLKQQYANPQPGTYYSEGISENWCADFVSWSLKEIGSPLTNPNSGSWRIPGTFTLTEYYESMGTLHDADSYTPRFGDVAIYRGDKYMGDHTNFVLFVEDGKITTLGGNESNQIKIQTYPLDASRGIVGFAKTF